VRWLARVIQIRFIPSFNPTYRDLLEAIYHRMKMLTKGISLIEENHVLTLRRFMLFDVSLFYSQILFQQETKICDFEVFIKVFNNA
jgi:hypothetical protein